MQSSHFWIITRHNQVVPTVLLTLTPGVFPVIRTEVRKSCQPAYRHGHCSCSLASCCKSKLILTVRKSVCTEIKKEEGINKTYSLEKKLAPGLTQMYIKLSS